MEQPQRMGERESLSLDSSILPSGCRPLPPPVCALFSAIGALKGQMEGETSVPQVSLSASGPRLSVNLKEEGGVVGRDGVRVSALLLFLKEINSLNHDQVMTKQDSPLCHLV